MSQTASPQFSLINGDLQKRANGVVALMQYTLFSDVTTSSLSISSGTTGNPAFRMTQLGGGLELDTSAYPIYISRIRLMARYRYGEYVSGYSLGLGVSF